MIIAAKWDSIGRCQLQLGLKDLARASFAKVVALEWERLGLKSVHLPLGSNLTSVLETAILSGEENIQAAASRYEDPRASEGLTEAGTHYCRALQALSRGDEAGIRREADGLQRVAPSAEKQRWHPDLGAAVSALSQRDEKAFAGAISRILERHARFATRGHLRGLEAAFICSPATSLAILAKRRGVTVSVDSRRARFTMKSRVTGLEQWQGKPTRDLFFQLEVNCLPLELN
jgi:hypothetical protein